ncbi:MAG: rhodanese-like domain-containing protein, partial [Methanothrix sp.]|nr:rhodanese-like domain-containing protein [Methanothrix sp.]
MTLRHIECKGFSAIAKSMLIYGIISVLLFGLVLSSPVLAGTETGRFAKALVSPENVSPEDIVLDISPSATKYVEGAVNVNYEGFLGDSGQLKSVSEIAALLGEKGISNNDSLVITGECLPCGGGPSPAFFSYWLLKYLGHEKVKVLEGSLDDWATAGRNTSNESATMPKTNYAPQLRPELLAT